MTFRQFLHGRSIAWTKAHRLQAAGAIVACIAIAALAASLFSLNAVHRGALLAKPAITISNDAVNTQTLTSSKQTASSTTKTSTAATATPASDTASAVVHPTTAKPTPSQTTTASAAEASEPTTPVPAPTVTGVSYCWAYVSGPTVNNGVTSMSANNYTITNYSDGSTVVTLGGPVMNIPQCPGGIPESQPATQ